MLPSQPIDGYRLLTLLVFLAACAPGTATPVSPTLTLSSRLTATPSQAASPSEILPATAASTPETPHRPYYRLNLSLDYTGHTADVNELIIYINQTNETLNKLVLAVEPML